MKIEKSMIATVCVVAASMAACPSEPEYPVQPAPSNTVAVPPVASSSPPPAPVACDALSQSNFAAIFAQRAPTEAKGMQPEGNPVCGTAGEGQVVEGTSVFLQPNMCYTVLANGLPNVTELDVSLVVDATAVGAMPAVAALAAQPLGVDSDTGAMATVGSKTACIRNPLPLFPVPAKIVIKARTGAGPVGAQLFSKKVPGF